ncbi:MAG: hypothetical protein M0013_06465 [Actinomycetota bacterium]|nr:hypothetical protein [Actinomycetota bacterium]
MIGPAQGAGRFTTPDPEKRFAAAVFQAAPGRSAISDDAETSAAVVGPDVHSYCPDSSGVAACTHGTGGEHRIAPGEAPTGCVVLQVPSGVTVAKVRWSLSADVPATSGGGLHHELLHRERGRLGRASAGAAGGDGWADW